MIIKQKKENDKESNISVLDFSDLVRITSIECGKLVDVFRLKLIYLKIITGKGLEFDRLREYVPGDEATAIDWNATARTTKPYVKVFKEERKLDVVTVLDVSNSMLIGTTPLLKNEYASVIASILSYSAILCGDKAGLIMMSNEVKKVIEPLLSTDNFFTIVRCLSDKENYGGVMDWALLNKMFSYLGPDTVVFIISDFINIPKELGDIINTLSVRFKLVVGIMIRDPRDEELPKDIGKIYLSDPETHEVMLVDARKIADRYKEMAKMQEEIARQTFENHGARFIKVYTNKNFVEQLIKLFAAERTNL